MHRMLVPALLALLSSLLICSHARAATKNFDFKDPKGVNAVVITLDSLLEPVSGIASGVTGGITFDPAKPESSTGKIVVEVASLQFPNTRFTQTAHGTRGLDAQSYPQIEFTLKKVQRVRKEGENVYSGTVLGDFTLHGVTKSLTVPLKVTYLPGKGGERNRGAGGDLLVLRTSFKIKRTDFSVAPGMRPELLADEIEVRANLVGFAREG